MTNILFSGYYGHYNTGDDSFIEVASWGAYKYWKSAKFKFITENMPIIQNPASFTGGNNYRIFNIIKIIEAISKANYFICAGGSTFHSSLNKMEPKNIALKIKKAKNLKMGAIGVSLGPYKSIKAEKENIELLKNFEFLNLRDKSSYDLALSYDLPYTPVFAFDLAALLPEVYGKINSNNNKKKILGISICNYESYIQNGKIDNERRRNMQCLKLLQSIAKKDPNLILRFFVFNGNEYYGDKKLTSEMVAKIKASVNVNIEIVDYDSSVSNTWKKITECELLISTRLHAAIFACFANIPFYLFEYHKKCTDFLETVGYEKDYRLFDANFDLASKTIEIIKIINHEKKFEPPLFLNQMREQALLNFDVPSLGSI